MKTTATKALNRIAGLVLALTLAASPVLAGGTVAREAAAAATGSSVSLSTALADAHRLAARAGDSVVRVEGASMLPYFGDGAVLVIRSMTVDALKPGMVVVYRNRFGETVAHRVEARMGAGWTVKGANNTANDTTLVTSANLMGTVYVTLYSDSSSDASELRISNALAASTPVALAATAR